MNDAEENSALRQEIIESQKTQADYLKWKLITVAAVTSVSLGFEPKGDPGSTKFLLCLVPLLCGYIDLISLHIMIRIMTIGIYLKASGDSYEQFIFQVRNRSDANPFVFEAGALHGSSVIFNALIIGLGLLAHVLPIGWLKDCTEEYWVSGLLGIIWTAFLWSIYASRVREIREMGKELESKTKTGTP